ncbi:MAG: hypothetical protein ACOC8N_05280 [Spirochaetota bacterium]
MRRALLLLLPTALGALALGAVSCTTVDMDVPPGFAEAVDFRPGGEADGGSRGSAPAFSAVSPEGMHYRVRVVRHYPRQELAFWRDALKNHLTEEGYGLLHQGEEFETRKGRGFYFEWVVPYGESAYIYLTAVILAGRRIMIAECGGEYALYTAYRDAIRESLPSIALRRRLF